jgi:energy-coupling factor transport system ATP-binding protein
MAAFNLDAENVVEVKNLGYTYMPIGHVALKNINLTIKKQEFVAIIGQNGSGKTTLIKHFNGLHKPTKGEVIVGGVPVTDQKVSDLAHYIGYVFQNPANQIFAETVEKEIAFGPKNLGYDKETIDRLVNEALETQELTEFRDEMPFMLGRGQLQRLAVASILSMDPTVLIIDEPTTGLDWRECIYVMELVKKLNEMGHTIIMTTHNMSLVSLYAKRVVVMRLGEKLLDGSMDDVFSQTELLKTAYIKPPQLFRLMGNYPELKGFSHSVKAVADVIEGLVKKGGTIL